MIKAPTPENERERLQALKNYKVLDTLREQDFNDIVELASIICKTPIALISLIDENRQWFKAAKGIDATETARDISFCGHAILGNDVFIVENATQDERFFDNPLVTGELHLRFYAGAPIITESGLNLGTICVIDQKEKQLNTDQKKALEALARQTLHLLNAREKTRLYQKSNKELEAILNLMNDGMVIQNQEGKITDYNQGALQILGLTENQLIGRSSYDPDWQAIHPDGSPFLGETHPAILAVKTGEIQKKVPMGIKLPHGETRWIKISALPIFENGNLKSAEKVLCTFTDITEEVQLAETKSKLNERLSVSMKAVGLGVWEWNLKTNELIWDQSMYTLFNLDPKDFNGAYDAFEKTLHPDDAIRVNRELTDTFNAKKNFYRSEFRVKKGNDYTYIAAGATCFYDKNGGIDRLVGANWDISDLKKKEQEVAYSAKMSSLGEMAGGVAHEINNPLSIIVGKTARIKQWLSQPIDEERIATLIQDLEKIESTTFRISKIIKGLKNFSRNADNDPFEITSIRSIINDTIELCSERFRTNNIKLQVTLDHDADLPCRPSQLSQVLMNLLSNSYDAVIDLEHKWVNLSVKQVNSELQIRVSDSGNGIDQEILNKIMQPFYTTKASGKGTGLGLSISKGLIEEHGGKLYYELDQGHTSFVVSFPIPKK